MSKMSLKDALATVLENMRGLSAEDLRAKLDKHRDSEFTTAMRAAREIAESEQQFDTYEIIKAAFTSDHNINSQFESIAQFVLAFEANNTAEYTDGFADMVYKICMAANDNSYALAA